MRKIIKFFNWIGIVIGVIFISILAWKASRDSRREGRLKTKKFKRRLKKDAKRYNDFLDGNPFMDSL